MNMLDEILETLMQRKQEIVSTDHPSSKLQIILNKDCFDAIREAAKERSVFDIAGKPNTLFAHPYTIYIDQQEPYIIEEISE